MDLLYSLDGREIPLTRSENDIVVRRSAFLSSRHPFGGGAFGEGLLQSFLQTLHDGRPDYEMSLLPGGDLLVHGAEAAQVTMVIAEQLLSGVPNLSYELPHRLEEKLSPAALLTLAPVYVEPNSGLRLAATEEILIRFRPDTPQGVRQEALREMGLDLSRASELDRQDWVVGMTAPLPGLAWRTLDLAAQLLAKQELVEFALPNFDAELGVTTSVQTVPLNDPLL